MALSKISCPWNSRKLYTIVFLEKEGEILLGLKKRGFGAGLWNGFGGKVEKDETVPEAAARELQEECGLNVNPSDLEVVGVIHFPFQGVPEVMEVHIFRSCVYTGSLIESDEMLPQWWPKSQPPFEKMWPDDKIWFPFLYQRIPFHAIVVFEGYTKILNYQFTKIEDGGLLDASWNKDEMMMDVDELWPVIRNLPVIFPIPKPMPSSAEDNNNSHELVQM